MRRVPVDNHKDRRARIDQKPLEEVYEHRSGDPPVSQHEAQLTLRADRRDQIDAEPCARTRDHRRPPSLTPGCSAVEVRSNAGLVGEEDLRALAPCATLDRRVFRRQPVLHRLGVLLIRPPERALCAQPELMQQSTHRTMAQLHVVRPSARRCHGGAGEGDTLPPLLVAAATARAWVDGPTAPNTPLQALLLATATLTRRGAVCCVAAPVWAAYPAVGFGDRDALPTLRSDAARRLLGPDRRVSWEIALLHLVAESARM